LRFAISGASRERPDRDAAVTTEVDDGERSRNFHAKVRSWSQRKRGSVQRTRIWKLQTSITLARKVRSWIATTQPWGSAQAAPPGSTKPASVSHGRLQPPRNSVVNSAAMIAISMNSESMNMPCFIALYSVK